MRTTTPLRSKLPDTGVTIFTTMSRLALEHGAINLSQGFPDFNCAPELIDAVAEAAAKVAHPLDNADLDYWYRKRMAKVYTQRALAQVAGLKVVT